MSQPDWGSDTPISLPSVPSLPMLVDLGGSGFGCVQARFGHFSLLLRFTVPTGSRCCLGCRDVCSDRIKAVFSVFSDS